MSENGNKEESQTADKRGMELDDLPTPTWKKKERPVQAPTPTVQTTPQQKPVVAAVQIMLHPDGTYTANSNPAQHLSLPMAAALADFSGKMTTLVHKMITEEAMKSIPMEGLNLQ